MNEKIWLRILAGLVLIAAVAGIGFIAFNAGVATHAQLPAASNGQTPGPFYGYGYWPPFPFFGLGCFGPLIALFLLFLALRAFSFMFWGPRWSHMGHRAWRRGMLSEEGALPPRFREWHERAHGKQSEEKKE